VGEVVCGGRGPPLVLRWGGWGVRGVVFWGWVLRFRGWGPQWGFFPRLFGVGFVGGAVGWGAKGGVGGTKLSPPTFWGGVWVYRGGWGLWGGFVLGFGPPQCGLGGSWGGWGDPGGVGGGGVLFGRRGSFFLLQNFCCPWMQLTLGSLGRPSTIV